MVQQETTDLYQLPGKPKVDTKRPTDCFPEQRKWLIATLDMNAEGGDKKQLSEVEGGINGLSSRPTNQNCCS